MKDHLEPYRRMVRSIRLVPPSWRIERHSEQMAQPVTPLTPVNLSTKPVGYTAAEASASGPTPDPSEHIAALVHRAVSQPTVLPATYHIAENIGDRISRLAKSKPRVPAIIAPKIPQPTYNGSFASTVETPVPESEPEVVVEAKKTDTPTPAEVISQPSVSIEEPPEATTEASAVEVEEAPVTARVDVPVEVASEPSVPVEETPEVTDETEVSTGEVEEAPVTDRVDAPVEVTSEPDVTVEQTPEVTNEAEVSTVEVEEAPVTARVDVPVEVASEPSAPVEETPEVTDEAEVSTVEVEEAPVEKPIALDERVAEHPTADAVEQVPSVETADKSEDREQSSLVEKVSKQVETVTNVVKDAVREVVESVAPANPTAPPEEQKAPTPVEPAPAAGQKTSEISQPELACPSCGSTELRKNGRRSDKQKYVCKDCGRYFVDSTAVLAEIPEPSQERSKGKAKGFGRRSKTSSKKKKS